MITLVLKEQPEVPLEAETLCPDVMATLGNEAIRELPVYLGKRQRRVEDFFEVDGEASDQIEIRGDAGNVKWIGRRMTRGRIAIIGNAGMHLGAHMKGGSIDVSGHVSDWLGGEMSGGLIRVHGNAGGQIGAAYRGSVSGMTDGTIIVDGTGGLEIGMRMKRGLIAIAGPVRDSAGLQMKGGTLIIRNGAALRTGAWMSRGTIISLVPIQIPPTFSYAATYNPTFLRLYARHLETFGFPLPYDDRDGAYERYIGDAAVPGKGELLVWKPRLS
ncbi:MAG: formylmethanofuran dehydrogenase subunit C [Acidobacteriota bacterium]